MAHLVAPLVGARGDLMVSTEMATPPKADRHDWLATFFFILMSLSACHCGGKEGVTASSSDNLTYESQVLQIQTTTQTLTLTVEVADTVEKQEQGLMNRTSLDVDKGMLFIFDSEGYHGFWMKDTPISLDLIFLSASKSVVYIAADAVPYSEDEIIPTEAVLYVVEVNGGYCSANGVQLGDVVVF